MCPDERHEQGIFNEGVAQSHQSNAGKNLMVREGAAFGFFDDGATAVDDSGDKADDDGGCGGGTQPQQAQKGLQHHTEQI